MTNSKTKRRIMVTLSKNLIARMEEDISNRGLTITKSTWLELAIEHELNRNKNDKGAE